MRESQHFVIDACLFIKLLGFFQEKLPEKQRYATELNERLSRFIWQEYNKKESEISHPLFHFLLAIKSAEKMRVSRAFSLIEK